MSKIIKTSAQFGNARDTHVIIRSSVESDAEDILAFHRDNANQYVDPLDEGVIRDRASDQRVMLVTSGDQGHILGTSVAYDYPSHLDGSTNGWVEVGAVRSVVSGTGNIMMVAQVLNEFLRRPPKHDFFTNIYAENNSARRFFERAGWEIMDEIPYGIQRSYGDKKGYSLDEMNTWLWMRAKIQSIPDMAQTILDVMDAGCAATSTAGQARATVVLHDALPFHSAEDRKVLELMSKGRVADALVTYGHQMTWQDAHELVTLFAPHIQPLVDDGQERDFIV